MTTTTVLVQTANGVTRLAITLRAGESVRQAAWRTAREQGLYLLSDTVTLVD